MPDHPARRDAPPASASGARLPRNVRDFLGQPHYAALASLDEDGAPRQAVVWFRLEDDDRVLVNSRHGRRWPANLRRDGRVALAVVDEARPTRWVGATGVIEAILDDQATAQADIAEMARRYDPPDEAEREIADFRTQQRVSFRIRLLDIHRHL